MKERPILFSAPMVNAILAGTKTMTRRIAKDVAEAREGVAYRPEHSGHGTRGPFQYACPIECPYGVPGDRLWVRETHAQAGTGRVFYRADPDTLAPRWTPAIHMPRASSRIDLEVAAVRVERLRDITEEDARAEGVPPGKCEPGCDCDEWSERRYRLAFERLWEAINGKRAPWASNPWTWVVSFKRVRP